MAPKKLARGQIRSKDSERSAEKAVRLGGAETLIHSAPPPGPGAFIRDQLQGVPREAALRYLDEVLQEAEDRIVESLPKLLVDIERSQYPAFRAIDSIELVRHGLRLIGGAS